MAVEIENLQIIQETLGFTEKKKRPTLLETLMPMDVVKFSEEGMKKLSDFIIESRFRGFGIEGLVFEQNFDVAVGSQSGFLYSDDEQRNKVIKIFNKWTGAKDFYRRISLEHRDESCKVAIATYHKLALLQDWNYSKMHVGNINLRNGVFQLLPNNSIPVNTVYVSPRNQIFGFSMMNVPDGEWFSWEELDNDEKAIFHPVINYIDNQGNGNFVRDCIDGQSRIMLVDPAC